MYENRSIVGAALGSASSMPQTAKQSEVGEQVILISQGLKYVDDLVESLANRLSPVLRNNLNNSLSKAATPEAVLVPHANELRIHAQRIEAIRMKLEILNSGLEL